MIARFRPQPSLLQPWQSKQVLWLLFVVEIDYKGIDYKWYQNRKSKQVFWLLFVVEIDYNQMVINGIKIGKASRYFGYSLGLGFSRYFGYSLSSINGLIIIGLIINGIKIGKASRYFGYSLTSTNGLIMYFGHSLSSINGLIMIGLIINGIKIGKASRYFGYSLSSIKGLIINGIKVIGRVQSLAIEVLQLCHGSSDCFLSKSFLLFVLSFDVIVIGFL